MAITPRSRVCPTCRGTGTSAILSSDYNPRRLACPTCDGVGWIMPAYIHHTETPEQRADRLGLRRKATLKHGNLEKHDIWLFQLIGEADHRLIQIDESLIRGGPYDRELKLAVLDLDTVVTLLKEAVL